MSSVTTTAPSTRGKGFRPGGPVGRVLLRPGTGLLALLVVAGLVVPEVDNGSQVPLLVTILGVLIFAYAWNPVGGMFGELSLAHVAFWAVGAYSVVLGANGGLPFVVSLLPAVAISMVLAALLVAFAGLAKLNGLYLMVFTLVIVEFSAAIARDWSWLGSAEGLTAIVLPLSLDQAYYWSVGYAAFLILLTMVLLTTRRGLVWLAARDVPERVGGLGWSVQSERRRSYMLTAALCAIGGGIQGAAIGFASPEVSLDLALIVVPLLAIYVGGPGTVWGPLVGVALLEGLSQIAGANSQSIQTAELAVVAQYLAALLLVALVLRRQRRQRQEAMFAGEARDSRADDGAAAVAPGRPWSRVLGRLTRLGRRLRRGSVRGELSGKTRPVRHPRPGPLEVIHLSKSFGGLHVLDDVSFRVGPGEVVGLIGPNGAGKSTICNLISGQVRPDGGTIALGDRAADKLPEHRRARLGLARTYQTPKVYPSLTLTQNVALAGTWTGTEEARGELTELGVSRPDRLGEAASLMERRMTEVATLAALDPHWVLLDEPLAGLSVNEHDRVLERVRRFAADGAAVLLIEHLVPAIAPVVDRVVVLDGGRLIAEGAPAAVLARPEVVDAYLGEPLALETPSTTTDAE